MKLADVLMLILFLGVCLGAGAIGGVATASSVKTWFTTLNKPTWNPPSSVFAPVWTTLYILMGISGWLIWRDGQFSGVPAAVFVAQLVLNLGWSLLFFGLRRPGYAFFEVVILWVSILVTMLAFWKVNHVAGWLLVPYLLWVSFASGLNWTIWKLNPPSTNYGRGTQSPH